MDTHHNSSSPFVFIILDGWGYRETKENNGIALAHTPFFDSLLKNYPHTLIDGSGPAVGLPKGVMGNSEVGHMNIGAGRIVYTGLSQIYQAIEDKTFYNNPALLQAIEQTKTHNSTLHLMGLLSDGSVHSHQDHLYALLHLAKKHNLKSVAVHCLLDGRDTPPHDGIKYFKLLLEKISEIGIGSIASIQGRYWAMDRDKRWDRNEKAFWAICGKAPNQITDPVQYLSEQYKKTGDEFIEPASVIDNNKSFSISENDAMIFFNFRADRAKQITQSFFDNNFTAFDRKDQALPAVFVCMAPYDNSFPLPVAFLPTYPKNTIGEIISQNNMNQLRIAETEKYAHVTFFFNGGRDVVFAGEDRALIPSPREVATYDLKPEMNAVQVKNELLKRLHSHKYGFIVLNFANADMVGHTAVSGAIIRAVETVDCCLSEIIPQILSQNGTALIFADHGNAEEMVDASGTPMTAHTTNLVPFVLVSKTCKNTKLLSHGKLCDVAPTALQIMGIQAPPEMTGKSLLC